MKRFLTAIIRPEAAALLLILLVGAVFRLEGVGFGLPALYDPDEPLFMMTALELLRNGSLNPHWFGHPGTTTIYTLALIDIVAALGNIASGRYPDMAAFVTALYADPGILFLPARVFIALCGLLCVYLTFRLGRTLFSMRVGLIAAGILAIDSLHIRYSQLIRTDMHASVFILLALLAMVAVARGGRLRHHVMAGFWIGIACATKWPSAIFAVGLLGASVLHVREKPESLRQQAIGVMLFCAVALVALVAASPYLVLDYATLLTDLHAEGRAHHPEHSGGGWLANLGWYLASPLLGSFAVPGFIAALAGSALSFRQSKLARYVIIPVAIVFLATIARQPLIWERWLVPILPVIALFAAVGIDRIAMAKVLPTGPLGSSGTTFLLLAVIAAPMLWTSWLDLRERHIDTRDQASSWVRRHVPAGATIMLEHGAIDLLSAPFNFVFPIGDAGCVDVRAALAGKIRYSHVNGLRSRAPVLDLGGVPPTTLPTCRADYAIITHYDSYLGEPTVFRKEIGNYRMLVRGGVEMAIFRPQRGIVVGPIVRIVKLSKASSLPARQAPDPAAPAKSSVRHFSASEPAAPRVEKRGAAAVLIRS